MDPKIVAILACPKCSGDLSPVSGDAGQGPLSVGRGLRCRDCRAHYPEEDGILRLMVDPSTSVIREVEGLRRLERRILDEDGEPSPETVRSLPWRFQVPLPPSYWSSPYWVVVSANFDKVVGELALRGGEVILDLGTGIGWTSSRLASAGCCVLAADISDSRLTGLRGAQFFFGEGLRFDRAIFDFSGPFPLRDRSVDIVVSSATLHHSRSLPTTISQIHRVLRPGGRLAIASETTAGLLRDNSKFGVDVADLDGEEHVYSYLHWIGVLRRAHFRCRGRLSGGR